MEISRIETVLLGSGALLSAVAGCSALASERPQLTLNVFNHDASPHTLSVTLLDADATDADEAVVYRHDFDLPAAKDDVRSAGMQEVAPAARYTVRVTLRDAVGEQDHFHFYPGCNDTDEEVLDVRVYPENDANGPRFAFEQSCIP